MLELWNLAEQNSTLMGWIVGGAVFLIGSTWAIVHGIRNPEPEYVAGLELGALSRTIFLVVICLILGAMSLHSWRSIGLVFLTFYAIKAVWAGIGKIRDYYEEKAFRRAR